MKNLLMGLSIILVGTTSWAAFPGQQRSVSEGIFNVGNTTYYSNGAGHYCKHNRFDWRQRSLSDREMNLFRAMADDGNCDLSFQDGEGQFNYRNVSYFKSNKGAFCRYSQFNPNLKWISDREARSVFAGAADHGICGQ